MTGPGPGARAAPAKHAAVDAVDDAEALDRSLQDADVIPKGDYAYVIHPLTDGVPRARPALLRAFVAWASDRVRDDAPTVYLAPEAMALPLAAGLSLATDVPYVVARKRPYGLPGERVVDASTGYHGATLHLNDLHSDDRIVVVDDVLSTGGTLDATLEALAGMEVSVARVVVFMDKGGHRERLQARHGIPVDVMRTISVTDGRVRLEGD